MFLWKQQNLYFQCCLSPFGKRMEFDASPTKILKKVDFPSFNLAFISSPHLRQDIYRGPAVCISLVWKRLLLGLGNWGKSPDRAFLSGKVSGPMLLTLQRLKKSFQDSFYFNPSSFVCLGCLPLCLCNSDSVLNDPH